MRSPQYRCNNIVSRMKKEYDISLKEWTNTVNSRRSNPPARIMNRGSSVLDMMKSQLDIALDCVSRITNETTSSDAKDILLQVKSCEYNFNLHKKNLHKTCIPSAIVWY